MKNNNIDNILIKLIIWNSFLHKMIIKKLLKEVNNY